MYVYPLSHTYQIKDMQRYSFDRKRQSDILPQIFQEELPMLLQCCCFCQPPTLFKVPSFAEMFPIEWFSYHLTYPKSLWLSSCAVKRRAKGCERERNFILFLSNISPKAYLLVFWVKIITFFWADVKAEMVCLMPEYCISYTNQEYLLQILSQGLQGI